MKINPAVCNTNFGHKDNNSDVRQHIRSRIIKTLGPSVYYRDYLTLSERDVKDLAKSVSRVRTGNKYTPSNKKELHVDEGMLQRSGIKGLWVREPNKLYSGEHFIVYEKIPLIKTLKDAGIKSVVSLCGTEEYEQNCRKAGLNYTGLSGIGNGNLYAFIIKEGIIKDLIKRPESYADGRDNKITRDLKEYVRIMKGKSKDLPYPIYYGCSQGSNMTSVWTSIYEILKDQDPKKPLSKERVEELVALEETIRNLYRY